MGVRRSGRSRWDSVLTMADDDERRLVVSYHGGDTTGADSFRVSPGSGVSRSGVPEGGCRPASPVELDRHGRGLLYAGLCGARPGILRADLDGAGRRRVRSGDFCGIPLAVHDDRFVVLDATRVSKLGFPSRKEEGLRLVDLERPGAGLAIPRSARALDAVVVGTRR